MTTPGLPGDKLYPPMNAPGGGQTVPGVQPGTSSGIILAQYVIIFGPTGGMFVYAGTPALGNPPIYSVSNANADPYGNTVLPGIWAGPPGSNQVGLQAQAGSNFGQLLLVNPGGPYAADGALFGVQSNGGSVVGLSGAADTVHPDSVAMQLFDNLGGVGTAILRTFYQDVSSGIHIFQDSTFSGMNIKAGSIVAVDPSTGTSLANPFAPETWHTITLDAGWTAGSPAPQYRKTAGGNVQFTGNASHANFTVGTNVNGSNPLPAAYRPANPHYWRSNDQFRSGLQLLGNGIIEAFPQAAGNTQIDLDGVVALL